MKKAAVLTFPGMNCEVETARALNRSGLKAEIVRWNEKNEILNKFDAIVIPGGFSFEDRGRSGMVSAKDPIIKTVKKMASQGKVVLGICNGAQVVVESGLVPGFDTDKIEMGLARNKRVDREGNILGTGFYHSWIYIKSTASKSRSAFNNFEKDTIFHLPIAHGEGRFQGSGEVIKTILKNEQNIFSYCDENGNLNENFPINPNGSLHNFAGISNPEGNVMALMPHPERTKTCDQIFSSINNWFENQKTFTSIKMPQKSEEENYFIKNKKDYPLEFYISLKITDNTEKTIEKALAKLTEKPEIKLERKIFFAIETKADNLEEIALKLASSGELFNENKEHCIIKIKEHYYRFENNELNKIDFEMDQNTYLALEKEDFVGEEKTALIKHHLNLDIDHITSGILWSIKGGINDKKIIDKAIFANPIAGDLQKVA